MVAIRLPDEITRQTAPWRPPPPPREPLRLRSAAGRKPERAPRLGPDDAIGGQPVAALEALDGRLGLRAEHAVGGEAERVLQRAHAAAAMRGVLAAARRVAAMVRVLALQHRARAEAERLPRLRPDHAVDREPVTALIALDGLLGLGAEDAVGGDAKRLLERADLVLGLGRVSAHPGAGLRGVNRRRPRRGGDQGKDNQHRPASGGRHRQRVSVGFRHLVWRLRGELTGSRCALLPGTRPGRFAPAVLLDRIGSPARPALGRGDSAYEGRLSISQKSCTLQDFLQ